MSRWLYSFGVVAVLAVVGAGAALGVVLEDSESGDEEAGLSEHAGAPPFLTGEEELPPGLAGRDALPPGLAKKLDDDTPPGLSRREGSFLPPGLARKGEGWLPPGLVEEGKIPPGHARRLGVDPVGEYETDD